MHFPTRTEYNPKPSSLQLNPERGLVLIGSCFADNIGVRAAACGWPVTANPCGPAFNAASITRHLNDEAFEIEGDKSWDFPTTFTTRKKMLAARRALHDGLADAQAIIITLGTSIVYERQGRAVANCHKAPAREFTRRMMPAEETASLIINAVDCLRREAKTSLIVTVSPVRHVREGLEENSLSKALLRVAARQIVDTLDDAYYFPAFEIINDDLRDYRWYATDMVHPSDQAVDYLWRCFLERHVSDDGRRLIAEAEALRRDLDHRPIRPASPEAQAHRDATFKRLAAFQALHPTMSL